MPLNKLENFISNVEGRILYVNPSDLDSTDSITNQGNSLTKPFKTIQRALLESARFSYLRGNDNDITEKTTILLFPGEHVIDNRPGYAIKDLGGTATAVSPTGQQTAAVTELSLNLTSDFDLTSNNNILYKFNSIYGGVVVPRGTSIVGLDLRKTKIRPKYVPNPTDPGVPNSSIFKITGACYFWQFSIFDGREDETVYVNHTNFSLDNQAIPTFSHHKLTCFEYADGVNIPSGYDITDLDMYYSKVGNAYNLESGRDIDQKFPESSLGFAKQRPEWEIVGAFASDPVSISRISSGDGFTPSPIITVTTVTPHQLTAGTPIKINRVDVGDYNVSTKVANVLSETQFTYLIPFVRDNLPASPSVSTATVTIETDTVSGASPYVFNISLRSVWGMQGMHADGSKASGFRSMVVAQFTAVSLQKDDRAFTKYNPTSRQYESITIPVTYGSELSTQSSSTNAATAYHLDSDAIYRRGWEISHIKISNDAFIQIVSVFAIGFTKHFDGQSGADASITNSNSNFGQSSLASSGFKASAFSKDNHAYVTSLITPRSVSPTTSDFDWISLDVGLTTAVGLSSHLYLFGYRNANDIPPTIIQGYRIGAALNDKVYVDLGGTVYSAPILMADNTLGVGVNCIFGTISAEKEYQVSSGPTSNVLTFSTTHQLQTGEKIILISETGDYPENIKPHVVYYAIIVSSTQIKLASSLTNANNDTAITIYGGTELKIKSRVSDKYAGDVGHPIQFDATRSNWFIHSSTNNDIYTRISNQGVANLTNRTNVSYIKRTDDSRSLNERLYKVRVVVPKEILNAKNPEEAFIIQESSTTGARSSADFSLSTISTQDYEYNRNPRFISSCTYNSGTNTVTVYTDLPHNLQVGNAVAIKNVTSSTNTSATNNLGYNGIFEVSSIINSVTFTYGAVDLVGISHIPGTYTSNTNLRSALLPRFEKYDLRTNYYIYRNDIITPYIYNVQDGIYHLYVLNASNAIPVEFTNYQYKQNIVDLYPQLDKDNINDNPPAAKTFAKRSPVGDVVTSDLKKSIVRETMDKFAVDFGFGLKITGFSTSFVSPIRGTATLTVDREHGLNGIVTYSALSSGSGYTDGTYANVSLFDFGSTNWRGAKATVGVSSGRVTYVDVTYGGSGYAAGNRLEFDRARIGFGVGAGITITAPGITNAVNNSVQITGIGTTAGGQYLITAIPSSTQISIGITNGDPRIVPGQYVINSGKAAVVTSTIYNATAGIATFTCSPGHGFDVGNKVKIIDNNYSSLGDYTITQVGGAYTFSVSSSTALSPSHVLKYTFAANDGASDAGNENLSARASYIFDNEVATLTSGITTETSFSVTAVNSGISTTKRFPLGSYVQMSGEIMRIASSTLSGSGNDRITVIRGALGTIRQNHAAGTLIKKIRVLPVEFRRPTVVRASGHTFEYLGYGPGNYSTGLPQVQVKTVTEREEFLSQAQEKSAGIVVYTGMNNRGDVFNGNTKTSSASGQVVSYNIPTPTVTGQDASRLSVTFDEITVKERILVEGGNSGTLLSQFDGPVTFNRDVKINSSTIIDADLKTTGVVNLTKDTQSTSTTTGALISAGGMGLAKNLNIGGTLTVTGVTTITATTASTSKDTGCFVIEGGAGIENNVVVGGRINAWSTTTQGTAIGGLHLGSASGTTNAGPAITFGARDASSGTSAQAGIYVNSDGSYGTRMYFATTDSYATGSKNALTIDHLGNITVTRANFTTSVNTTLGTNSTNTLTVNATTTLIANTTIGDAASKTLTVNATPTFATPVTFQQPLIGAQNQYLRIGNAFFSSGGNFTHIANHEWYNGSTWQTNGQAGALYQQAAQNHNWYRHDGAGNHTTLMSLDSSANLSVSGSLSANGNLSIGGAISASSSLSLSGSLSVGGSISANGDITAFASDERLKTNIKPLDNALDKVSQLNGFTYNFNEIGETLGFDPAVDHVGVSAQQVKEVLPEAVAPAPANNDYLTVKYEKLVPLLIEAIKDLNKKVEDLENKLNNK